MVTAQFPTESPGVVTAQSPAESPSVVTAQSPAGSPRRGVSPRVKGPDKRKMSFYLPPDLAEALEAHCRGAKPRIDNSTFVEAAVRNELRRVRPRGA